MNDYDILYFSVKHLVAVLLVQALSGVYSIAVSLGFTAISAIPGISRDRKG